MGSRRFRAGEERERERERKQIWYGWVSNNKPCGIVTGVSMSFRPGEREQSW